MAQVAERYISEEEYLEREACAERKHEYFHGKIYAMAGATEEHNLISVNVAGELRQQFKGRLCRAYSTNMRVLVSKTRLYTYPDVIAVCGEPRFTNPQRTALLNPTVIVEVLSASTESYDRGEKFDHYRTLESLTDYLLIAQDKMRLEHYVRQPDDRWMLTVVSDPQGVLEIESIGCTLRLVDVYEKVEFVQATEASLPLRADVESEDA
jgi:Uma2 family endonuclease